MTGKQPHRKAWINEITSDAHFRAAPGEVRARALAAQIRSLYELTHYGVVATILLALMSAAAFYGRVPLAVLGLWLTAVVVLALVRCGVSYRFRAAEPPDHQVRRWGRAAVVTGLLQAGSWAGMLWFPHYTGQGLDLAFAVMVISLLGFGCFATIGFFLPAYLSFSVPMLAALTATFVLVPGVSPWMVAVIAVGGVAMLMGGTASTRVLRGSILQGYERQRLIRDLTEEKERIQVTLESIGDGVLTTDVEGRVTYLNPVAERLAGWSSEDAAGRALADVLELRHDRTGDAVDDPVRQCLERRALVSMDEDVVAVARGGEREAAVELTVSPIRDFEGRVIGAVVAMHDVTELRGMARVMSYQAQHDPLTGLANRQEFESRLWQALEHARYEKIDHAVCYLDLDQFKLVNDTCGHSAGDELLKQITEVLQERIRDTDVLARLGGDEFGLLLYGCSLDRAGAIAEDLCARVREFRFNWGEKVFNVGVSIGVLAVDSEQTPAELLAAADAACYLAKDEGRNRIHRVHAQDVALANRHGEMEWTTRIQKALDEDLFRLRFQRIVPLCDPEFGQSQTKAEFLISMVDGEGALIAPGLFLPAAERFSMMPKIDRLVVRKVLTAIAAGRPQLGDVDLFTVNLSGQSLNDESFLDYVIDEMRRSGVSAQRICFEITETAVIANMGRARRFIRALRAHGCKFALDDFGSGLSSFGYLRSLPVDYLKIDGQFVRNMAHDPVDRSMVESINQVGHVMGIQTIAEFVEDEATRLVLSEVGVDYAQGYGIHRPELLNDDDVA